MGVSEYDEEGFPVINDDTIGTLFTTPEGVTYVCQYVEALECFAWVQISDPPSQER